MSAESLYPFRANPRSHFCTHPNELRYRSRENRGKAVTKIRMAAEQGAQVMVLQELFASQYFCFTEDYDHFGLAETIPGTSFITFSELAKELGVVIVASLFEKRGSRTLPQYCDCYRCRWRDSWNVQKNAHTR